MKIVIDILECQYERMAKIADKGDEPLGYWERVVMRGTPLPKGHGDLIDRNEMMSKAQEKNSYGCVSVIDIERAKTIIEADTEDKE